MALLALIAFVVAIVVLGTVHGWVFWFLLGMIFLALDNLYVGTGRTYPWYRR